MSLGAGKLDIMVAATRDESLKTKSLVADAVAEHANSTYFNLNAVARIHWTHASRSSRCDQISGKKRHHVRYISDDLVEREDEIFGGSLLPNRAIDATFDDDSRPRIDFVGDQRTDGTERVEAFSARPLVVLLLQVARGDVVHARVSIDVAADVFVIAQLVTALADDDAEFAFVVDALRDRGTEDDFAWSDDGRRRLAEDEQLSRHFVAEFLGVIAIVASHADDFRGHRRSEQTGFVKGDRCNAFGARVFVGK